MVINKIHLGPVVFAKTLAASIAARQAAPPASNGSGVTCVAGRLPDNYGRGELLVDTAMDLETNATTGLKRENSLIVRRTPKVNNR